MMNGCTDSRNGESARESEFKGADTKLSATLAGCAYDEQNTAVLPSAGAPLRRAGCDLPQLQTTT